VVGDDDKMESSPRLVISRGQNNNNINDNNNNLTISFVSSIAILLRLCDVVLHAARIMGGGDGEGQRGAHDSENSVRRQGECGIKDDRHEPEVHTKKCIISACMRDSNDIPTAMPMFSGLGNTTV